MPFTFGVTATGKSHSVSHCLMRPALAGSIASTSGRLALSTRPRSCSALAVGSDQCLTPACPWSDASLTRV